ncbi:MAG: phosphatidate cytidylyltransferase [bacterium]|nr:phosphatidate cytidylyltransferase [bacterium]
MLSARIISGVLFYALFFLGLFNPFFYWVLPVLLTLACLRGLYEFIHFGSQKYTWPYQLLAMAGGVAMLADAYYSANFDTGLLILGMLTVLSLGLGTLTMHQNFDEAAGNCVIGTLYVTLPLALITYIWRKAIEADNSNGQHYLIFLVLVTQASDIGAYFVGRAFGRHKLAPRLSPGKTIEGFIGGVAFTLLVAVAMKLWWNNIDRIFTWPEVVGLALIFSVVGPIGDLTESRLKRIAGIKDSGRTYTGHGGVLDIIDSLLFTTIIYYAYLWIFHPSIV